MIVAVPKEIMPREYRVGLTPAGVRALVADGHRVLVETGAGAGSGFGDEDYRGAGGTLVADGAEVYGRGELVVKVKEPLAAEYPLLRPGQLLFTFLHLAAVPELAAVLLEKEVSAIAYETVQAADGSLPLLQPMSLIAGRMAVQVGARFLEKEQGGKGVLLGGAPGVRAGRVVILGAGTAGGNALQMAVGLGARVTVLDIDPRRLGALDEQYGNRIQTLHSTAQHIEEEVPRADLLIGAVLVTGARAPRLVEAELVTRMEPGSVIIDVAIDQGGCVATSRPTTHDNPTLLFEGVLHYGVRNMPGAVSRTSTFALTGVTLPLVRRLAGGGLFKALEEDISLLHGVNTHGGAVRHRAVAEALKLPWRPFS